MLTVITTADQVAAVPPGALLLRADGHRAAMAAVRVGGHWRIEDVGGVVANPVADSRLFDYGRRWEWNAGSDRRPVDLPTAVAVLADVAAGHRRSWPDLMDAARILEPHVAALTTTTTTTTTEE